MSLDVVAPDTITSWVASAFALHKQDGLGIAAQPAKVNKRSYGKISILNHQRDSFVLIVEITC